jgi:hypothetical protein
MATGTNPSGHEPPQTQPERIYIGGLDPPFLKSSDVIQRLEESLPTISIVHHDVDDTKSYVHLNAVALDDGNAFEVISKAYNNVKWKGCRLTVQPARPHFLQRLEEERRVREAAKQHAAPSASAAALLEESAAVKINAKPVLRRRLRIRQRYATEAHRVDTKPCHTTDWHSFDKIVRQMRTRRDRTPTAKKKKGVTTEKTQAFYSRAVLLKFGEDGDAPMLVDSDIENDAKRKDGDVSNAVDVEVEESSEGSSDKNSDDSSKEIVPLEMKKDVYDWSTDDSSQNDQSADSIDHAQTKLEYTNDKELADSYRRDSAKPYNWSSDESDFDSLVEDRPIKVHHSASEFESAIDFDDSDEEPMEAIPGNDDANENTDHVNLQKDVETNLDVLSQLFPDLKDVTPKPISKPQASQQIGWSASSMQRYDPTKESSQQFELEDLKIKVTATDVEDESEENHDEGSDDGEDDDDDEVANSHSDMNERVDAKQFDEARNDDQAVSESPTEPLTKKNADGNLYRESQLEEVFRNARDAGKGGGFQVSALFGEQPEELKEKEKHQKPVTSIFSFNFDLAVTPCEQETKPKDGSSFALGDAPIVAALTKGDEFLPEPGDTRADKTTTDTIRPKTRRRGLMLPDSIVKHYYNKFFELNDGLAIQQDPDGFRNDETVKADWHKERHALTQDWKRKRKYALSRLQKNNKFRK